MNSIHVGSNMHTETKSGALYIGATRDLSSRVVARFNGEACRTTRLDTPSALLYFEKFETLAAARRRENQLKRWSRAKKEASIQGDLQFLKAFARRRIS